MPSRVRPRTLILVPIVHSVRDMGLLGQQAPLDEAYGRLAQARWASIEQRVRALQLDWSRVKVYQDGL
ncbi:MAG: hypothetical protein HY691_00925, partial [Chloroflexi bacterium]|nr:hypothetical protein [Chloroflexota bacterium]